MTPAHLRVECFLSSWNVKNREKAVKSGAQRAKNGGAGDFGPVIVLNLLNQINGGKRGLYPIDFMEGRREIENDRGFLD